MNNVCPEMCPNMYRKVLMSHLHSNYRVCLIAALQEAAMK
jgi:hypothetical protein